jgi:hypothetical protein
MLLVYERERACAWQVIAENIRERQRVRGVCLRVSECV